MKYRPFTLHPDYGLLTTCECDYMIRMSLVLRVHPQKSQINTQWLCIKQKPPNFSALWPHFAVF